jgi:membrane protein implicated in regulation of membrane protease activity
MLIVALVMAVIGLAALVTAVVTSNQIIAWVCIAASVIGVILLIIDALRERRQRDTTPADDFDAEYPEDKTEAVDTAAESPEKKTD